MHVCIYIIYLMYIYMICSMYDMYIIYIYTELYDISSSQKKQVLEPRAKQHAQQRFHGQVQAGLYHLNATATEMVMRGDVFVGFTNSIW